MAINDLSWYANCPIAFTLRFVYRRWAAHAAILTAVLARLHARSARNMESSFSSIPWRIQAIARTGFG
jgi:hypothetical protein